MSGQRGQVDLLILAVERAAGHLADCKTIESELDGQRSQVKSEAIARLMGTENPQKPGSNYSATAAADIVMNDTVFALHESDRREATAETIRAMGAYKAACFRAEYAIKAADLEIVSEEPLAVGMGKDHAVEIVRAG